MKQIKLTHNKFAIVDDECFEYLNQFKWQCRVSRGGGEYATRSVRIGKKVTRVSMHRVIMGIDGLDYRKIQVDHINNNTLDNRKENLRLVTPSQNQMNKKKANIKNSTSKYKGVSKKNNKWIAKIKKNGKIYHLGSFHNEDEAADVYNRKANELFGEYALLNNLL
jgi:hypothetical protein